MAVNFPLWVRLGAKDAASKDLLRFAGVVQSVNGTLKNIGRTMTLGVTLPTVAFGAASINAASDLQYASNQIKVFTGASAEELAKLNEQARQLGKDSIFSALQVAQAQKAQAKAGFQTNAIYEATPGILNLATAAEMELADAASLTAKVMKVWQLEGAASSRIADMFTVASTRANQNLGDLAAAFGAGGTIAKAYGLSIEETTSLLSKLADAGFTGGAGGSALALSLKALTQLKPDSEGARVLHKYGVSLKGIFDQAGKVKDFTGLLEKLGAAGIRPAETQAIFGRSAQPVISLLSSGVGTLRAFTASLEQEGIAAQTAGTLLMGAKGATERLKGSWDELLLSAGKEGGLLDMFTGLVQGATGLLDRFSALEPATKRKIVILGLLAAAAGPVVSAFSLLLKLGTYLTVGTRLLTAAWFTQKVEVWSLNAALGMAIPTMRTATVATGALNTVMRLNPFVAAATAVYALITALDLLTNKQKEVQKSAAGDLPSQQAANSSRWDGSFRPLSEADKRFQIKVPKPLSTDPDAKADWDFRPLSERPTHHFEGKLSKLIVQFKDVPGSVGISNPGGLAAGIELDVGRALGD